MALPVRSVEQSQEHEALCRRCGRCCQEKLMVRGRIYLLRRWCQYLDQRTRLCLIYEQRRELNPECLDVETGRRLGVFPKDCPYVRDLPDYIAPIEGVVDDEILEEIESGEIDSDEAFERRIARRMPTRPQTPEKG